MLKDILPNELLGALSDCVLKDVYEIRLRIGQPIVVNHKNIFYFIAKNQLTKDNTGAVLCNKQMLDTVLLKASNQSLYSVNEEIKEGFISVKGGIRIGLVGEGVFENKTVKTIKNICSLNIRVPHEVFGCSLPALPFIKEAKTLYNTLILSPPGAGKTTFLRDLALQTQNQLENINILILDERYEIAASHMGQAQLCVGAADVFSGVYKKYGFERGIRSMNPHIIFTDEIATKEDVRAILYAQGCGVRVVASAHAYDIDDLKNKSFFEQVMLKQIFSRFVVLSCRLGAGTIEGIYDNSFVNLLK